MVLIILDTNFILIPMMFNVDIFSEIERICIFDYELSIIDRSLDELKNIKTKEKRFIKPTLELIKKKGIKIIKTKDGKNVDEIIIETAKEKKAVVATQDALLRKSLKKDKIPVIYMRQKKYLELSKNVL